MVKFSQDDSVFQILETAYMLLEDGEHPMKIIRMCMFIAILEGQHLNLDELQIMKMFKIMNKKFHEEHLRSNSKKMMFDHGSE